MADPDRLSMCNPPNFVREDEKPQGIGPLTRPRNGVAEALVASMGAERRRKAEARKRDFELATRRIQEFGRQNSLPTDDIPFLCCVYAYSHIGITADKRGPGRPKGRDPGKPPTPRQLQVASILVHIEKGEPGRPNVEFIREHVEGRGWARETEEHERQVRALKTLVSKALKEQRKKEEDSRSSYREIARLLMEGS